MVLTCGTEELLLLRTGGPSFRVTFCVLETAEQLLLSHITVNQSPYLSPGSVTVWMAVTKLSKTETAAVTSSQC